MNATELKAKIKSGNIAGWYIFCGEEDYLKKYYMRLLREAAVNDDTFALFNHAVFEGDDVNIAEISEAIKSPPMMGEYKLVEWKFANLDLLKEKDKKALEEIFPLKEEYPSSIFAITANADGFDVGTPKRPSKNASRLGTNFDILNFPRSSDSQLLSWLKRHFDAEGVGVDIGTLNALLFRSGRSMDVLVNEVKKLCCYAKANRNNTLSTEDVEIIASPSAECDAFALSNAVIEKNVSRAFEAMADLKQRRTDPNTIISMLERVYSDLTSVSLLLDEGREARDIESILKFHPFKTKLYIGAAKKSGTKKLAFSLGELRRIDASSKSGGYSGYGVIEIFITQNIQ